MKTLCCSNDMDAMLAAENAALFIWVGWSMYARHGNEIFRAAKDRLAARYPASAVSWFIADLSSQDATPVVQSLHRWLESQDRNIGLFPSIDLGDGSAVLIKKGRVVGFQPSAVRLGVEGFTRTLETALEFASLRDGKANG